MSEQDDIVREFLVESHESLDALDGDLVALEEAPDSAALVARIFRSIHTIKGASGFLGFARLGALTHAAEHLLAKLRDGGLSMSEEIADALLEAVDAVRACLRAIEAGGTDGDLDHARLIERLQRLASGERADEPRVTRELSPADMKIGGILVGTDLTTPQAFANAMAIQSAGDERHIGEIAVATGALSSADLARALKLQDELQHDAITSQNLRVQVGELDRLVNLVGELVLTRNQILQALAEAGESSMQAMVQRLDLVTSELQDGVMKIRMQPIGNLWSKYPRQVRDLAHACGKKVRVQMEGVDTELDKTLLEALKDPLTHIVRNAVGHGIESPEERRRKGKPEEGLLSLRAYHESGQVTVEIADDGCGLDHERIRAKAVEKGLLNAAQAGALSPRETTALIFRPGFSTADSVTDVSGRGVGMDVVKTNVEKIGGTVEVLSERDRGTTLRVRIPLTLAIVPALVVGSAGDRYAIPQVHLVELVRCDGSRAERCVEEIHGGAVLRLRGKLLPILRLERLLGARLAPAAETLATTSSIVVLQLGATCFGLVVDEVHDTEEIVVKPLDRALAGVGTFAGSTILGDGQVALIVDVAGLARAGGIAAEQGSAPTASSDADSEGADDARESWLVFRVAGERRLAVPLSAVDRLEEFTLGAIERSGGGRVVQYRDRILPLYDVAAGLNWRAEGASAADGMLPVIVHERGGQRIGLVVDAITDIVETERSKPQPASGTGLSGSKILGGSVTDLLDLDWVAERCRTQAELVPEAAERALGSESESSARRQLCTFRLGDLCFGVDVQRVQEVLRTPRMTRVPRTVPAVRGLINLRGQIVLAIDLCERLGMPRAAGSGPTMSVVLRTPTGAVSMLVDSVGEVVEVDERAAEPVPPNIHPLARQLVCRVYEQPAALLLELEAEALLACELAAAAA